MIPKSRVQKKCELVLLHELPAEETPAHIVEQEDGLCLFRSQGHDLDIRRLVDGPAPPGQPQPVARVTLRHVKIQPLWLNGDELVYLGERTSGEASGAERKILGGQVLFRASLGAPGDFKTIAEYPLGCLHFVARQGARRFFERIGAGHDAYYEDGFLVWDQESGEVTPKIDRLPEGVTSVLPRYLHSFSHRQGDPSVSLSTDRFSLRRLRPGADATWGIENARVSGTPRLITGEHETVSCLRLVTDRLIYLRGPTGAEAAQGINRLVCHLASDPQTSIEAACGPSSAWQVSAGRANLFHVHGDLITAMTDRMRIFHLNS